MANKGTVTLSVIGDVEQAKAKFRELGIEVEAFGNKAKSSGEKLASIGSKMSRSVTLPVVAGLGLATKAASDLEQSVGAIESIFGEAKGPIEEFGETAAETAGLSKRQVNEMASVLGAQLQGMGIQADEAAGKVIDLEKRGADMAATFGGPTSDAVNAISALLRGERDTIERYGVTLKDADIKARILAMGLDTSSVAAEKKAVALASLNLLMEQTAKTEGAFNREQDTTAGATARAKAAIENSAASLGANLLPIAAQAADKIAFLAEKFGELPGPVQNAILALGGIAAATGPILTAAGNLLKLRDAIKKVDLAAVGAKGALAGVVGGIAAVAAIGLSTAEDMESKIGGLLDTVVDQVSALTDEKLAAWFVAAGGGAKDFEAIAARNLGTAIRLRDALHEQGKDVSDLDRIIAEYVRKQKNVEASTKAAAAATQDEADALDAAGDAAAGAGKKIETFGEKIDEAVASTLDLGRAQRDVDDAYAALTEDATDNANRRADAEERVADAIEDSNRRIRDARQDLADAEEDLQKIASGDRTDARRRVRDAAQDVADAEADGAEAVADARAELDETNSTLDDQAEKVEDIGEAVAEVVKQMVEEGAKASEIRRYLDEQKQRLIEQGTQLGLNRGEIEKILALWQEIAGLTGPLTPRITQSADSLERQAQQPGGFGFASPNGITLNVFTADNPDAIASRIGRELSLLGGRR